MRVRRSNGEGSVYLRKDGRWEAATWLVTVNGGRKRVRVYARSRDEARAKLIALQARSNQGIRHPDSAWRVGEYLDYWLREVVKPTRRESTWEIYEMTVRRHIKPYIGGKYLTRLTVQQLQIYLNERHTQGTSARMLHEIRTVLSAALSRAIKEELVTRNVARLVELPRWQQKELSPWSIDQARRFLSTARGTPWYGPFFMLIHYGMRRGEVLGLRWCDVDFDASTIYVRQQLQRHNSGLHFGPVKTDAGKRLLPIFPAARLVLTEAYRQHFDTTPPSGPLTTTDLVFSSGAGTPIEPNNLVRVFHQLRVKAGLPRITVHYLRHTTATLLKNVGVPARDAQLILGHAHVSTTQQLYQHGDLDGQLRALGRIETVLAETQPPASSTHPAA